MKTNKKLPLLAVLSAVVMAVGLILFFVLGFNVSGQIVDRKSITVTYDAYITIDDKLVDELEKQCDDVFVSTGLDVKYVQSATVTGGGSLEFYFDKNTDTAQLQSLAQSMNDRFNALESTNELANANYEVYAHTYVSNTFTAYIVRAAIAAAAVIAVSFVYVAIRYKLNMAAVLAVTAVQDVALVVALTLIFRIPVGTAYVAALGFVLVYSLFNTLMTLGEMRTGFKNEDVKLMSSAEAVACVCGKAQKSSLKIALIGAIALVALFVATIFTATEIALFAIPALIAVVVAAYSQCIFVPALYTPFKTAADKKAIEKAKYDYKIKKNKKEDSSDKKAEKSKTDNID